MAIVKCAGPTGEPGFGWRTDGGDVMECHIYKDTPSARASALRAAMRDGTMAATATPEMPEGDPRFRRDG